ncbi:MAG: hypothetical protein Ct9H300mP31_11000 [Acidimicrobiaceae bacterium]|nr:MAG: hypothetical protein Ct9H300mP31_11000 [Acidimicrobiaceae bacterium]
MVAQPSGGRRPPGRTRVGANRRAPGDVGNDALAATLAEARFGAGRNCDDLALVTLGTGIGGGFVLGGRLHRGAHGFSGEPGHMVENPPPGRCTSPATGAHGSTMPRATPWGASAARPQRPGPSTVGWPWRAPRTPSPGTTSSRRWPTATRKPLRCSTVVHRGGPRGGQPGRPLGPVPRACWVAGWPTSASRCATGWRQPWPAWSPEPGSRPPVEVVLAQLGPDAGAIGAALLAVDPG